MVTLCQELRRNQCDLAVVQNGDSQGIGADGLLANNASAQKASSNIESIARGRLGAER